MRKPSLASASTRGSPAPATNPQAKPIASSTSAAMERASTSKRAASSSTHPARCLPPPSPKTASRASSCPETSACPPARVRGRCAAASRSCACRGEAPTKAPSSVRTGAHTPVGSSRKSPSPATMSGASAWPPASSARKSTSSPASPDATKPCTYRHDRAHARLAALPRGRVHTRRDHGHRRRVFQRLLRRARRVRARRRHLRRAQPTPTPRSTQRRPVLRVRDPPVRMRRRAPRRRARTVPRHRAHAHRQAAQPGAGSHGAVPPTPGRPDRHGAPAYTQTPARTRRRRGRSRGSVAGRRRQEDPR